MKIDIYCSARHKRKYLSVPAGTEIANMAFPADLDQHLRELRPFKSELEIIPGKHYIGLDAEDILRQIEAKGFAQHSATVTITVREGTTPPKRK